MEHLIEYIDAQDKLNHLDLSGLGLPKDEILKICNHVSNSTMISSLHLSDNGINNVQDTTENLETEIKNIFGLTLLPNIQKKPLVHNLRTKKPKMLQKIIKEKLGYVEKSQIFDEHKHVDFQDYSTHYVRRKQIEQVHKIDQVCKVDQNDGVGRNGIVNYDNFVMTREFNYPELVFNQTKDEDNYFH